MKFLISEAAAETEHGHYGETMIILRNTEEFNVSEGGNLN
jgi:hypothetical protein